MKTLLLALGLLSAVTVFASEDVDCSQNDFPVPCEVVVKDINYKNKNCVVYYTSNSRGEIRQSFMVHHENSCFDLTLKGKDMADAQLLRFKNLGICR